MRDQDELAKLTDRDGVPLPDALALTASRSTERRRRARQLERARAYLELHIEQGPVLESLDLPLGVVLGTFGVERSRITWRGQAAHAGSTPMDKRRDALAGAAKLALWIREHRSRDRRRRGLHVRRRRLQAGHRHVGRRDRRAAARPAAPRRDEARADARAGARGVGAVRARGGRRRLVGADLADRADPLRRRADRARRRVDPRGRRARRTGCRRARCTTRPRSRAPGSRR